jgi:hypothetical protein
MKVHFCLYNNFVEYASVIEKAERSRICLRVGADSSCGRSVGGRG